MGLLSKEKCALCGNEVNALKRIQLNDGQFLCADCFMKTGINPHYGFDAIKSMTVEEISERIKAHDAEIQENNRRIQKFATTYKVGDYIWFDDRNKWFAIPRSVVTKKIDKSHVFSYEEIASCDILEDGNTSTSGGLGKAVVGGALFGVVGAMAGATSKKTKQICTELEVVITTKNLTYPTIYIKLIDSETNKNSFSYKNAYRNANNIVSKLKSIEANVANTENAEAKNEDDKKEEIIKKLKNYKMQLDEGLITRDEFKEKTDKLKILWSEHEDSE